MKRSASKNVVFDIRAKELSSNGNLYRRNMKIVRKLICQDTARYKLAWEKHSKSPIAFEGYGINGLPQPLYKLPVCAPSQKLEDALMCSIELDKLILEHKGWRPALLALAADNRLVRYDLQTGEVLQDIFLSSRYKFRHLSWETDPCTILLRSIHTKHTAMARAAGISQPLLMVLAVFSVFPLEFVGMLEIDKNIFGKDVSDAAIAQSTLVITHQNGMVKLYSFQNILEEHTHLHARLGKQCEGLQGIVGSPPLGVPCSIKLRACPPALFQVQCHSLQIGGFPWHYIISPYKQRDRGSFLVHCYATEKQAINGVLDFDSLSVEPDKCLFHPDDSGRILHRGPNSLRILRTEARGNGETEVQQCFEIKSSWRPTPTENGAIDGMTLTSSGRLVKKRIYDVSVDPEYETIQSVDYENDLDIIGVTALNFDDETIRGYVCFYDNMTGQHLKEIPLEEPWEENCDHTVCIDLDIIIHIVKYPSRKFVCYLYRLDRTVPEEGWEKEACVKSEQRGRRRTLRRNTGESVRVHREEDDEEEEWGARRGSSSRRRRRLSRNNTR
ncbi:DDB1- and CUL4-associated factor 17-like isoform X2 [Ptychodera flava]|uniref:DDB1- and CUL4-associated factor 17-like isoform X2 n=1 Tax=Ptychodera flava TaxID=63121 RepID=UPI003969FC47